MNYSEFLGLITTITIFQTLFIILGLIIYQYFYNYLKRKGENRALLEDSPRLKAIETKLDRLSLVSSELGKEKLETYLSIGSLFARLQKEFELIGKWVDRITQDEELARLSVEIKTPGSLENLKLIFDEFETTRISREWLLHWKANAILYTVTFKGYEVVNALEFFELEKENWEIKRGHILTVESLSHIFGEFQSLCSTIAFEDIESGEYTSTFRPPDNENFAIFAKQLGDICRAESKKFAEDHPDLVNKLRNATRKHFEQENVAFKARLAESIGEITEKPLEEFKDRASKEKLEVLYEECLMVLYRMLNEPLANANNLTAHTNRLAIRLSLYSTDEILEAFNKVVEEVELLDQKEHPPYIDPKVDPDGHKERMLKMLKPAAQAQGKLEELIKKHSSELKSSQSIVNEGQANNANQADA